MIPAPLWVRDPCAILAEGAARGIVVDGGRIVERVPAGAEPITPGCTVFDAARHVVLPGLVNTHHHFSTCHPKMIRSRCIIATMRNSVAVTVI